MWTPEEADSYLLKVLDNMERIKPYEVTILTGSNGSGKSLIRKGLAGRMADELNMKLSDVIAETSIGRRMSSSMLHDDPWNPTSLETWKEIRSILKQIDKYIVIDEPEVGTDEDVQLSIVDYINSSIKEVYDNGTFKGCLIITHNKMMVRKIRHHRFINLDGLNEEDWLDRIPEPRDMEELNHNSLELFRAVQRRLENARIK